MKDIPMKRILRLYLAAFLVLFVVANFLSNEARADTGTLTTGTGGILKANYNMPQVFVAEPINTTFNFDSDDYTRVYNWSMYKNSHEQFFTAPKSAEATAFTVTAGGTVLPDAGGV